MNAPRDSDTATLLPNGLVLAAGGLGGGNSAELYNPTNGIWTVTGSMTNGHWGHTATLLPNGKVLVAGDGGPVSAELYDPVTTMWTSTGSMIYPVHWHTATLLTNGQVLVAGGYNGSALNDAEIYDPASGTWKYTGALATARFGHTATLLANGKVLVTGGSGGAGNYFNSAELYDPATGWWTTIASMSQARLDATATLLPNGKVLVAGGYESGYPAVTELYDPTAGTWTATGSLNQPRYEHTATLLRNGKVLVAGGWAYPPGGYLTSAELYDPATAAWTSTSSLATSRWQHTATLLPNGEVLVAGGGNNSSYFSSAEVYDVGLGFNASSQPQIPAFSPPLGLGYSLSLTGSLFRGISEGSCGDSQDSPADYPVVQLHSLGNEQTLFLPTTSWSTNSFTSTPVTNFPPGLRAGHDIRQWHPQRIKHPRCRRPLRVRHRVHSPTGHEHRHHLDDLRRQNQRRPGLTRRARRQLHHQLHRFHTADHCPRLRARLNELARRQRHHQLRSLLPRPSCPVEVQRCHRVPLQSGRCSESVAWVEHRREPAGRGNGVDEAGFQIGLGLVNSAVLKGGCFCLSPFPAGVKFTQRQNVR